MPSSFLLQSENKFTFDDITCAPCRRCYTRLCVYLSACASHVHSCVCVCVYVKMQTSTANPCAYVSAFFNFIFFHFVLLLSSSSILVKQT